MRRLRVKIWEGWIDLKCLCQLPNQASRQGWFEHLEMMRADTFGRKLQNEVTSRVLKAALTCWMLHLLPLYQQLNYPPKKTRCVFKSCHHQTLWRQDAGVCMIAMLWARAAPLIKKEHLTIEEHNGGLTFLNPQLGHQLPRGSSWRPRISFQDIVIKCGQRRQQPMHILKNSTTCEILRRIWL